METYLQLAREAARLAGDRILEALEGGRTEVRYKGPRDPVTVVDEACQEIIRQHLVGACPGFGFWGEEGGARSRGEEWCWIVDPIDGTRNFSRGYPMVAVSIALQRAGQVVLGVVHDPIRREVFSAVRGQGAFRNHQRLEVSPTSQLGEALLVTGFAAGLEIEHALFSRFERASQGVRRDGCASLNLCYVACGRLDACWHLGLSPWDVAAGALLVEEAGGMVTDCAGRPFTLEGRQLVASNVRLHRQLVEVTRDSISAESC